MFHYYHKRDHSGLLIALVTSLKRRIYLLPKYIWRTILSFFTICDQLMAGESALRSTDICTKTGRERCYQISHKLTDFDATSPI